MKENNSVFFEDGVISVEVTLEQDTVWLSLDQIADLFERDRSVIGKHIRKIFAECELDRNSVWAKFAHTALDGKSYNIDFYNLDMIISVGYRVKSKRGILFRQWATKILKEYTLKGVVYNDKRLKQLERMQEIQVDMMEGVKGFDARGDLFGKERDESFQSSINQIYQSYGGVELYPTLEDKAVNLLYFITKNHSFYDGNKRIAATIFIYFLMKNRQLIVNNRQRISNTTLATLTVLIASSKPEERDNILAFSKELIQVSSD
ncbi:MAG: virulence protein RhuM/Fic/DOC family protein [Anaerorhabdus sp.]|uniref:virulence protein RhuM/Fic/DOC family protein n=1 Tax=Anaerorhabdus sp. TaxID=1872524 RepID=UPI002FC590F8